MVNDRWLVVWNIFFGWFFHSVGHVIIPTGPNSMIFQRGRSTTNQITMLVDETTFFSAGLSCQGLEGGAASATCSDTRFFFPWPGAGRAGFQPEMVRICRKWNSFLWVFLSVLGFLKKNTVYANCMMVLKGPFWRQNLKNIVRFCLGILRIQPELSICKSIYVITNDSIVMYHKFHTCF